MHTKEIFEIEAEGKLPVLSEVKSKEIKTDTYESTHILIEGDNYHALMGVVQSNYFNYIRQFSENKILIGFEQMYSA